jgi:hypothetical protein
MKRTLLASVFVVLAGPFATAQDAFPVLDGQQPAATLQPPVASQQEPLVVTPSTVTPEMWLYSQEMRRYDDPAQAVRRKAELRAAQRMQRVAAMKYFGMSNARPQAECIPMMGHYSPAWVGNGQDRYDWAGVAAPTVLRVETIQR